MAANEDPFSEAIQLKKAKKRLLGALVILVILLIFSYFFLDDRSIGDKQHIKISFIDEHNDSLEEVIDSESKTISFNNYYIQVGVFSDKNKSNELISQIKSVGIECLMDEIAKDNQNLYLVKTTIYNNYSEAEAALDVLKNNKFSGIIKKNNS